MASRFISCPDSGYLEEIEYEDHALGMLVTSCTRFSPACALDCGRLCVAALDRRRSRSRQLADESAEITAGILAEMPF